MTQVKKMLCPDCGVEMNHHAEKVDFVKGLDEPQLIDPDLEGTLEEFFTCPECGKTESRYYQPVS
ncbi:MAG: hypothetical protein ACE5GL_06735 [Calditrichia bacterium]